MFIIEFRKGTFFQNLAADHGGPRTTAQRFKTRAEATAFADKHSWIYMYGGMVVPA